MTHAVDILITSYYQPEYLDECLESVARQTWQDFRVHVVDDSPGNPVQAVIDKWRGLGLPIDFTQNEKNIGAVRSLQKIYAQTQAEYVVWLNHDDVIKPQFLERLVLNGMMQHPECGFGYSLYDRFQNGQILPDMGVYRPDLPTGPHQLVNSLCITNWIITSFAVIRRSTFDEVGGLLRHIARNELVGEPAYGYVDLYIFARLAARSAGYVLNESQGVYRIHGSSSTAQTVGLSRRAEETVRTYDFIFDEHTFFTKPQRYLSKANCTGRLLSDMGVIQAVLTMLQSSELGRELRPIAKELLQCTYDALSNLIFDLADRGRPLVTPQAHLEELRGLIQKL